GPNAIQITAGATHAFACALRLLCDPGDEVLLLAPYWPLIRGNVLAVGARPVEVPFTSELYQGADPAELLAGRVTKRTAAIYVTTPTTPDGKVLDARALEAVAEVAVSADLWVLADEVYEDYAFDGRAHRSIATLPGLDSRTLSVYSFSKSYGLAGLRVGYVTGPEGPISHPAPPAPRPPLGLQRPARDAAPRPRRARRGRPLPPRRARRLRGGARPHRREPRPRRGALPRPRGRELRLSRPRRLRAARPHAG